VSAGKPKAAREAMAAHLAEAERVWRGSSRASKHEPGKPMRKNRPRG
jgi:DNA-binding FadR family transcriptional regulator